MSDYGKLLNQPMSQQDADTLRGLVARAMQYLDMHKEDPIAQQLANEIRAARGEPIPPNDAEEQRVRLEKVQANQKEMHDVQEAHVKAEHKKSAEDEKAKQQHQRRV